MSTHPLDLCILNSTLPRYAWYVRHPQSREPPPPSGSERTSGLGRERESGGNHDHESPRHDVHRRVTALPIFRSLLRAFDVGPHLSEHPFLWRLSLGLMTVLRNSIM
jgi:hypothetical protein